MKTQPKTLREIIRLIPNIIIPFIPLAFFFSTQRQKFNKGKKYSDPKQYNHCLFDLQNEIIDILYVGQNI